MRLVCENHPTKAWPDECDCGPGMTDPVPAMAEVIGAVYDGYADPVETPNNWARAVYAAQCGLVAYLRAVGNPPTDAT